jgi:hypothetical protein
MLTPLDARRRWFGALFLILGLGLLVWGTTLLDGYLRGRPVLFVLFWAACALFTCLALVYAALDMLIVRRRTREEQVSLAEKSFASLAEEEKRKRGQRD